jgi:uncharacterized protein YecT (DUF1311 family)
MFKHIATMTILSLALMGEPSHASAQDAMPGAGRIEARSPLAAPFDSQPATTSAEAPPCSSASDARADQRLETAFRTILSRFTGFARRALQRDQAYFRFALELLARAQELSEGDLADNLADAAEASADNLLNWRPARDPGLAGEWEAIYGPVSILTLRNGTLLVMIKTHKPLTRGRQCEIVFYARPEPSGRVAVSTSLDNDLNVTKRRDGQALSVAIADPRSSIAPRCRGKDSRNGKIDGVYFFRSAAAG